MFTLIIISTLINHPVYSNAIYLIEQANYVKPKYERNNVLNKGLWVKDTRKLEKSNYGDFIFRADSGNGDNLVENNYDAFAENFMDTVPVFSSYVERNKRSIIHKQKPRLRKSLNKCKDKRKCSKNDDDKKILFKTKFISQLRPATLFNDYPYEVAVLLANNNKREIVNNENIDTKIDHFLNTESIMTSNIENVTKKQTDYKMKNENVTVTNNKTSSNNPKRSMAQSEYQLELKENMIDKANKTKHIDGNKISRNVFDQEEKMWQSSPIQNVIPAIPADVVTNKRVSEKGLVKILTLLTKMFKKVVKQHNEIQEIDRKLHGLNADFMKNVADLDNKFQEFDIKYTNFLDNNEELRLLSEKFSKKSEYLDNREKEINKNLRDFEAQQKNFLVQQHQFYTIQKYMLEQNENINRKQALIAKTQSEISHRQNNFARVLKKAKQFYADNKFLTNTKLKSISVKSKNKTIVKEEGHHNNKTVITSTTPVSTNAVKINLFSIPKTPPLRDHDKFILEEKNERQIDDLVYKYYFNNTYIDNLMKSNVLTAVISNNGKSIRNAKNKRNHLNDETTILLPVGEVNEGNKTHHRIRRWIRHPNKVFKKIHSNEAMHVDKYVSTVNRGETKINEVHNKSKNDPFYAMAANFCNEIGQNMNTQMLNWCVEKSLRRLKSIDMTLPFKLPSPSMENITPKLPRGENGGSLGSVTNKIYPLTTLGHADAMNTSPGPVTTMGRSQGDASTNERNPDSYFPDNDELESKVKQYELRPDPEGTVYFDGSLHTSDIVISGSDALSDIMPGLDSNSHVDVDPLAIDLQARRRAYVRRLNENILKMNS